MKKSLSVSFLFIGTVIGAGFSSGREILTFFSGNIAFAPFAIAACGCVFFLASMLLLNLSKLVHIRDIADLCAQFPTRVGLFFEIALIFCFVIICSMMLSGADSLFGSTSTIGLSSLLLFVCGCCVVIFGTKGLLKVNFALVPVLLCFILFVSFFHLAKSGMPFAAGSGNYITSIFEGISYSAMNLLLAAVILLGAGSELSKREIVVSSAVSAVTISAVILIFLLAMNTSSQFLAAEMPIVPMCAQVSGSFKTTSQVAIWVAIFTTFSSSFSVCFEYFKRFCPNPPMRFLLLFAICYPISRIGFAGLVGIFMPAMGVLGIALLTYCTILYRKIKPKKANNNRDDGWEDSLKDKEVKVTEESEVEF